MLWEFAEWVIREYIDPETFVGYTDTLGDLLAGGLGSVIAGFLLPFFTAARIER